MRVAHLQVGVAVEFEDEDDDAGGEGDEVLDSDDEEMGEGEEEEGGGGKAADLRTNMDVDDGEEAAEEGLRVSQMESEKVSQKPGDFICRKTCFICRSLAPRQKLDV